MVGTVDVRESKGATPTGDDSGAVESAMTTGDSSLPTPAISKLADGGTMAWARDSTKLKSGVPMMLKFRVIDRDGNPVKDLEPYMGMAAHAVIVRSDFSVFAHVHPSGSVPMASLMLVSADSTNPGGHSGMVMAGTPIAPEVSIPYGFPRAGDYRLFVQVKRRGQIETGAFDVHVE
jgi:hypothetical protein